MSDETLPFDVENERWPAWSHVASALVIVVSGVVALRIVPMFAVLPFLVASALGRRFAMHPARVTIGADGIVLGRDAIPRDAIVDVWQSTDGQSPRVVVAWREQEEVSLAVLHLENGEQAARFTEAAASALTADHPRVVGYRPRLVDLLAPLRFIALGGAFFATGSQYGLFAFAFFLLGAWPVLHAKQLLVTSEGIEVRTLNASRKHPFSAIETLDRDTGVIGLKDKTELRLPSSALRDPTLSSATWLEALGRRAFDDIQRRRLAKMK